ncbi:BTAD domain-containing putative transcriptional regulator, partial [Streptomyces mesophilus]
MRAIGTGGRQAWFARDVLEGRDVLLRALRQLHPDSPEERAFRQRAHLLRSLNHPHLVRTYDYVYERGVPYVAQEYVDGVSLGDVLRGADGPLPFWLLARLAAHTARALAAAHEQSLGHGPLRPADVLIDASDGTVKLTGFLDGAPAHPPREDASHLRLMLRDLGGFKSFSPWSLTDWQVLSGVHPATRDIDRGPDALISLLASAEFEPITQRAAAQAPQFQLIGTQLCPAADQLSPDTQACLVILLERYGRSVPAVDLSLGLEERPRTAEEFHHHLDELMRVLGPGVIASGPGGFAVLACPAQIDVHAIRAVVDRAGDPQDTDDTRTRRSMIQSALDGFEDEPLPGIPGPAARRMRATLRALRLQLLVSRSEADLDLGDYERAAIDLTYLLARHPDHQDFRRLHMLALRHLGRIGEAIESYEEYRLRLDGPNPDTTLLGLHDELYRELLASPERERSAIVFEFIAGTPDDNERAQSVVGRFVNDLLARDVLAPDAHELLARTNGYLVITEPGTSVLPLLPTLLAELARLQRELPTQVSLRVMFWHNARPVGHLGPSSLAQHMAPVPGDALVILSPPLYEEALSGAVPLSPSGFTPVSEQGEVVAYVHWVAPEPLATQSFEGVIANEPSESSEPPESAESAGREREPARDLLQGPFTIPGTEIPKVNSATTAVVYLDEDEDIHDPDLHAADVTRYYEVDLTPHQEWRELPLPSAATLPFTASVELSWQVSDAIAFAYSDVTSVATPLFEHLSRQLARITRRYTVARLGAAQQAVQEAHFAPWPVPGLTVSHAIRLSTTAPPPRTAEEPPQVTPQQPAPMPPQEQAQPSTEPRPPSQPQPTGPQRPHAQHQPPPNQTPSSSPLSDALSTARVVLLSFDGPVVRLYAQHTATSISRELARTITELRHPDEALRGDRLLKGTPINPSEGYAHPLDLLRAIAHHRLAPTVAEQLTQSELRTVTSSFPTPHADPLIRTLHAQGRIVGIVTDVDPVVVSTYLDSRGLGGTLRGGVHGRTTDLTRLMPHPDCLRRALAAAGCTPSDALLITSSVAELEAAETLGITTIGYARDERTRSRLEAAGCHTTITDLHPLLAAARAIPP